MSTKLKSYFPMLWDRLDLLGEIRKHKELAAIFNKWSIEQQSDTGLKLELLQKFLMIPLDIFRKKLHYNGISNKLDAWLLFFSSDDPDDIIHLIEEYPEFQAMYEQAYAMCRNVENIMGIFSEELKILDRNTVQLMIDEMQDTINSQKNMINVQNSQLLEKDSEIADLKRKLKLLENG